MSDSTTQYVGRVKWFNKKSGFGFVTIVGEGDRAGTDVFTHHSQVNVGSEEQYRYLVQGEYVSFTLGDVEGDAHEFQAIGVRGIEGGPLMCETLSEVRTARAAYAKEHGTTASTRGGRRGARGRGRGRGRRDASRQTTEESQTQSTHNEQTTEETA